jgi:hypothetical protein
MRTTNVTHEMTKLERVAISTAAGGVWLLYCLIEDPAPPLPIWARWSIGLLIAAWWSLRPLALDRPSSLIFYSLIR